MCFFGVQVCLGYVSDPVAHTTACGTLAGITAESATFLTPQKLLCFPNSTLMPVLSPFLSYSLKNVQLFFSNVEDLTENAFHILNTLSWYLDMLHPEDAILLKIFCQMSFPFLKNNTTYQYFPKSKYHPLSFHV